MNRSVAKFGRATREIAFRPGCLVVVCISLPPSRSLIFSSPPPPCNGRRTTSLRRAPRGSLRGSTSRPFLSLTPSPALRIAWTWPRQLVPRTLSCSRSLRSRPGRRRNRLQTHVHFAFLTPSRSLGTQNGSASTPRNGASLRRTSPQSQQRGSRRTRLQRRLARSQTSPSLSSTSPDTPTPGTAKDTTP